jgi:hypothetical protein
MLSILSVGLSNVAIDSRMFVYNVICVNLRDKKNLMSRKKQFETQQ